MKIPGFIRRYFARPMVRPWALATPALVLLVALPLLRPLRHPDPTRMSDSEALRLATVQAIVEYRTTAIDKTLFADARGSVVHDGKLHSPQPPTFAMILAGVYWVLAKAGLSMRDNPILVPYLLTMAGVTIPVAAAGGLIYRMSRTFELRRPWRAGLAAAVVFGGGLISYATVLNPHAPAAALVLGAAAALVHVAAAEKPQRNGAFVALAGLGAALAAAIDPPAIIFLALFAAVILAMRLSVGLRIAAVLLYAIGALPALVLHTSLALPITGQWLPSAIPSATAELAPISEPLGLEELAAAAEEAPPSLFDAPVEDDNSFWMTIGRFFGRMLEAFLGAHGLLSHFPVLIIAFLGIAAVMHRHWPATTKTLAAATAIGSLVIVVTVALSRREWASAMYASRWFVVFLPLMLFWIGAWVRRSHHPATWATAGTLLAFSVIVSLVGATNPYPRNGFQRYTFTSAFKQLIHKPTPTQTQPATLAGRH